MGVFLGSNEISNIYVGGNTAEAVYLGSELVWPTERWEYITATSGTGAMTQSRAIASSHGLNYQTVEYLPLGFDLSGSTTANSMLFGWGGLKEVELRSTDNVTNMSNMFNGCSSLVEVELTDCSKVTNASNMFGTTGGSTQATSLERLILPGMTRGFNLLNTKMGAPALNDLFHSLGTASGSQTINIGGAPGAFTCDRSIATSKGWTISSPPPIS